jgi:hypothetical protein
MNEREPYPDPALAERFKDWLVQTAPPAAPDRLVYAVMDDVERLGHRPRPRARRPFDSVLQYVALTVVIAIGVAAGTLLTRANPDVSGSPSPRPSASPSAPASSSRSSPVSPTPGTIPSLAIIDRLDFARAPGPSAIGLSGSSMWVGTPEGDVVELVPGTGAERSRTSIGAEPITIIPYDGILWIGSGGPDLVWLDPTTHEVGRIPGGGGHVVLSSKGSLWVSRQGEFVRLDPVSRSVVGSIRLPDHRASDAAAIVGVELWAGSGPSIVRLELPSGSVLGTIPGQPDGFFETTDGVFAVDRGALVRLAGPRGEGPLTSAVPLLDELPQVYGQAIDGDRLWVAGPMPDNTGVVISIDVATATVVSRTPMRGVPRALAFVNGSLWVAVDDGSLVHLAAP